MRCAADTDALEVVANNMDKLLVTNTAQLRSIEDVRERAEAVAANFRELKELAKDDPAVYEAGKNLMAGLGGKALPPGLIGRLVLAANEAGVDALRKLSSRSSARDIHRAVTQLRDALVRGMADSGAEQAAAGPDEKQACRNFLAALLMARCGGKLRAMQGAFRGDTAAKLISFYVNVGNGHFDREGIDHQAAMRIEDEASSHMAYIGLLKTAVDQAADRQPGAALDPFPGDLDPDEIAGSEIFDDLVDLASR